MGKLQIQKVGWWHERLADWMIANPDKDLKDAATYFNCAVNYIYIIKNSDSFKQYWASRSEEASNCLVSDVKDKMLAVTEVALDRLADKLQSQGELMPMDTLVGVVSMGMKSLGYGARAGPVVQVNQVNVSPELLAEARRRMEASYSISLAPAADTTALPAPTKADALLAD